MQIGPSLSVFQALGTSPAAPETMRIKPTSEARPVAEVLAASGVAEAVPEHLANPDASNQAPPVTGAPANAAAARGARVDLLV